MNFPSSKGEEGRRRDLGVGRVSDDARVEAQAAVVLQGRQERRLFWGSGFEVWELWFGGVWRDEGRPRGTEGTKRGAFVKSLVHTIPATISNNFAINVSHQTWESGRLCSGSFQLRSQQTSKGRKEMGSGFRLFSKDVT